MQPSWKKRLSGIFRRSKVYEEVRDAPPKEAKSKESTSSEEEPSDINLSLEQSNEQPVPEPTEEGKCYAHLSPSHFLVQFHTSPSFLCTHPGTGPIILTVKPSSGTGTVYDLKYRLRLVTFCLFVFQTRRVDTSPYSQSRERALVFTFLEGAHPSPSPMWNQVSVWS